MPKLHILSGVLEGKAIDLIEERITMGRALDNMIRLEDGTISHHHAMLLQDGTGHAPPPSFGSASPFGKRKKSERNPLVWAVLGLGLIALLALVWFVIK